MGLVFVYSGLLILGLGGSQLLPVVMNNSVYGAYGVVEYVLRFASLVCLSFIMMHAGMHFHVDRNNLGQYAVDYLVAMTSAAVPWIFAAIYFALLVEPHEAGPTGFERWKQALLVGRFAAPTSAGVLFSMLDACNLSKSWLYTKAKVLAIFDDLDTILLMVPLKVLLVGFEWEVGVVLAILTLCLVLGWTKMHAVKLHHDWYWVMLYAAGVAAACDGIALLVSWALGPEYGVGEIHIEVLLPAFVLGMVAAEAEHEVANPAREQRAQIAISAVFMLLVGLSMPPLFADKPDEWNVLHGGEHHKHLLAAVASGDEAHSIVADSAHSDHDHDDDDHHHEDSHGAREDAQISLSAGMMVLHVFVMSVLMVVGKLSCFFNYRKEASWRERLALGLGMCPRGEVGAGVIVVAASVGVEGNIIGIAVLALSLNLVCTGGFIALIRRLLEKDMREKLEQLQRGEPVKGETVKRLSEANGEDTPTVVTVSPAPYPVARQSDPTPVSSTGYAPPVSFARAGARRSWEEVGGAGARALSYAVWDAQAHSRLADLAEKITNSTSFMDHSDDTSRVTRLPAFGDQLQIMNGGKPNPAEVFAGNGSRPPATSAWSSDGEDQPKKEKVKKEKRHKEEKKRTSEDKKRTSEEKERKKSKDPNADDHKAHKSHKSHKDRGNKKSELEPIMSNVELEDIKVEDLETRYSSEVPRR